MIIENRAFRVTPDDWAHVDFTRRLRDKLEHLIGGRVCELGAGTRPALDLTFLLERQMDCLLVDISYEEPAKVPTGYQTLAGDVGSAAFPTAEHKGRYDVVFSRVLAEHVRDPRQFHINVRRLLVPGGLAMHFFPTLWWPPFLVNKVLPEAVSERILSSVQPWRKHSDGVDKFPAYYRWCFGPTRRQANRLSAVGFSVEHCVAYFGESSHAPGRVLSRANERWTRLMLDHPNYHLTSYASYTLRAR